MIRQILNVVLWLLLIREMARFWPMSQHLLLILIYLSMGLMSRIGVASPIRQITP